jgi:hypothetical protein
LGRPGRAGGRDCCAGNRGAGGWDLFGQVQDHGPGPGDLDLKEGEGVALNFNDGGIKVGFVLSQEGFQIRSIDESGTLEYVLLRYKRQKTICTCLGLRKSEKEHEDRLDFPIERQPGYRRLAACSTLDEGEATDQ